MKYNQPNHTIKYKKQNRMVYNMDNKWNIGEGGDMPIGFGLSLAANAKSMEAFANMTDAEKEETVEKSRQMHTRTDMEQFVNSLGETRDNMF